MDSFLLLKLILLAYAILAASRPFATITSLTGLYLRIRRFFFLVQTKKVISMNYGSSTSSWKPWRWMRLDLIFSMRDIYISPTWIHSQNFLRNSRNTEFKDILPWKSLNDDEETPNQRKSNQKLWDEMEHPTSKRTRSQWKLRQQPDENFQMEAKPL